MAVCLAALIGAEPRPDRATALSYEQAPAKDRQAKTGQAAKPAKRAKKKKVAKETDAAPDEPTDPEADPEETEIGRAHV